MTSFVHPHFPTEHPGALRIEALFSAVGRLRQGFDGTRGMAAVLLAGFVAALLILADRVVDAWTGGGLMAAWLVMWAVAFAALALFAGTARRTAVAVMQSMNAWSSRVARARADERLWATAQADPRVMADLRAAASRSEQPVPRIATALRAAEQPARRSLRQALQDWRLEVKRARADVAFQIALEADPRMMADLQAARGRAEAQGIPSETQTLLRADCAAAKTRDDALARGSRYAYYMV